MIKRYFKKTDMAYFFICMALSTLSVLTLYSITQYGGLSLSGKLGNMRLVYTQIMAVSIGLLGAVLLSLIDYRRLLELWPVHVALCWGLVLLTFIPGIGYEPPGTGSRSWIAMPLGMSFQPTELAKISFYLTLALHLEHVQENINNPKYLFPVLAHIGMPVLLIHFQGDDGTAMVFLFSGLVMLIMAGLNRWVVFSGIALAGISAPILWKMVLSQHQKDRIIGLFNPELFAQTTMHQQLKGRIAIGAGRLTGRGLFQPEHFYVPRSENDFIFSYFAESCGFIGCVILLGLLFAVLYKSLLTAKKSNSRAGSFICIGVFSTLLFQTVINISMNLMLMPVMGVTLPFMSAGGTSVLMVYLSIGLLLSVGRYSKKKIFDW